MVTTVRTLPVGTICFSVEYYDTVQRDKFQWNTVSAPTPQYGQLLEEIFFTLASIDPVRQW